MTTAVLPPPEEDVVEPPSRAAARAGREVLERVMLQLSRLPAKLDRGPVVAAIGGALSALRTLARSEIDDPDHLEILRAAAAAAGRAHGEMSKAEASSDGELTRRLGGVFDALSAQIEPTITIVLRRQEKLLRRAPEAAPRKPEQHVFQASAGAPRLFSFERPTLGPLVRVAAPAHAAREEAARDAAVSGDVQPEAGAPGGGDAAALDAGSGSADGAPGGGDAAAQDAGSGGEGDAGEVPPDKLQPIDEAGSLEREVGGGEDEPALSPEEAERLALRRLARDTAEELGSLGLLRTPVGPITAWAVGPLAFEERLLHHLDAFMALAEPFVSAGGEERRFDVLAPLLDWAGDAVVPDPSRAFARAFLLGCVAGEDTAAAAVTALRQSHPITYEAQRDALALAPHPGIAPLLGRMITDESPALVRVGLAVLERRKQAAFENVAPFLSHPDAAVRAAAARCLRAATAPQAALHLLAQHAETEEDEAALAATAESLVVLGARRGLDVARSLLGEEARFPGALPKGVRVDLLRLLAMAGGPSDGELLLASLGHDPAAAAALGWLGDAALVPAMLGALADSADLAARAGFCQALVRALHRITGLGRAPGGDPRTAVHLVDPPLDPRFWRQAWEEKGEGFAARRKYRFGSPFSPLATIAEAESPETPAARRRDPLLELAITSRGASRVHEGDWVVRQRLALAEVRERVKRGGDIPYPDGQWPREALFA